MRQGRSAGTALLMVVGLLTGAGCAPTAEIPLPQVGSHTGPKLAPMTATTPLRGVELLEDEHRPVDRPLPARAYRFGPARSR